MEYNVKFLISNADKFFEKPQIGNGVKVTTTSVKQSRLRKALKNDYVKTAILIIIVIGSVISFWFGIRAFLGTEYPFMAVATPSMVPTLEVGDLIVVQGYANLSTIHVAPETASNPGDIIVFWHWDPARGLEHWVHRAIGNVTGGDGKRYLKTQGDANLGPDYHYNITSHVSLPGLPLDEEYVIGKVVAEVPYVGQVALFMQTPSGRIIIIVLVVALLIVEFIPFSKKKEQVPEQVQTEA